MKKNLPTDIKSKALRDTYYTVQNILAKRYDADLSKTTNPNIRKALKEQFQREIRDAIDYYVNME